MAFLEGAEHAILGKALIRESMCIDLPLVCISNNKSLVTSVKSTKVIEDKRLYIDICTLDGTRRGDFRASINNLKGAVSRLPHEGYKLHQINCSRFCWGLEYHEAIRGELKGGLHLLFEHGLRESGMACAIH